MCQACSTAHCPAIDQTIDQTIDQNLIRAGPLQHGVRPTIDQTIDQIRAGPNSSSSLELRPTLSARLFVPLAPFHASGPSGWLPLRANRSVSSGSPLSDHADHAFDGFASTAVHNVLWLEHALPTAVAVDQCYDILLAADDGCPPAREFQAHECNYSQRVHSGKLGRPMGPI